MRTTVLPLLSLFVLAPLALAPAAPPVWLSMKTDHEIEVGVPLVVHVTVRSADLPPGSLTLIAPEESWQVVEGPTSFTGTLRAGEKVRWDLSVIPLVEDREAFRVRFEAAGKTSEWTAGLPAVRLNPRPGGGAAATVTLRGRAVYVDPSGAKVGIRHAKVKLWDDDSFTCQFLSDCHLFMGESETDGEGRFSVTGWGWDLGGDLPDPYVEILLESQAGWVLNPFTSFCFASADVDNASEGATYDVGDIKPSEQGSCDSRSDNRRFMYNCLLQNFLRDAYESLRPISLMVNGSDIPPVNVKAANFATYYGPTAARDEVLDYADTIFVGNENFNADATYAAYAHHFLTHRASVSYSEYGGDSCSYRYRPPGCAWDVAPGSIPFIEGFSDFIALYIAEQMGRSGAELKLRSGTAGSGSFEYPPHPSANLDFAHIEGYSAAVLWDLHDPVNLAEDHDRNGSRDLLAVPFDLIWQVMAVFHPTSIEEFFYRFSILYPYLANSAAGIYDENHLRLAFGAELMASGISVAPTRARRGDAIQLSGIVTNRANLWSNETSLQFYLSSDPIITTGDQLIGDARPGLVAPGQSASSSIPWTVTASAVPGNYWIGACADSYNMVYELDEANNCSSGVEFEVLAENPPLPPATACFSDDFSQPDALRRWTVVSGSWRVINGNLNTVAPLDSESWAWAGSPPVPARLESSYSCMVTFLPVVGRGPVSQGGIMFCAARPSQRFDAGNSGYTLDWYGTGGQDGGLRLIRWDQGNWTVVHSTGTLLPQPPRAWQIEVDRLTINVYGDGRLLLSVPEGTYRGGYFGLWSWVDQSVTFGDVRFLGKCDAPPPPAPPATACFSDDFSRVDTLGSWTVRSGDWSIASGELETTTAEAGESWIWAGSPPVPALRESGYSLKARFKRGLAPGVGRHGGVMFCAANPTSRGDPFNAGYTLDWIDRPDDHGMRLSRWDGGVETPLATGTPNLPDPPSTWQIALDSQTISVYGDRALLLQAQDSGYRGGYFGAWAWLDQTFDVDEVRFLGDCRPPPPPMTDCFSDDFSQPDALQQWTIGAGRWSLARGSLATVAEESPESWAWAGSPPVPGRADSGYAVRVSFPKLQGSKDAAGIMLCARKPVQRFDPGSSGYTVDWYATGDQDGGFRLLRWDEGKWTVLALTGASLSRPPLAWQIEFAGTTINVYGDGALLLSAVDSRYRGGYFGLWSSASQAVSFDDVRYLGRCDLPTTPPAPPLPPATDCFSDDFSRPDALKRWTQASGRWAVVSQALDTTSADAESWIWAGDPPAVANGQSAYSFRMVFGRGSFPPAVGRHAGVMFCAKTPTYRFDPENEGYTLDWIDRQADHGLRLLRIDEGQPTTLAVGGDQLVHPPALLQIAFDGDLIRIWGDGKLLLEASDSRYRGGHFGLWSWFQQSVTFDDVRFVGTCQAPVTTLQRPGDCNQDGGTDLSDAICLLGYLFMSDPTALPCGSGTAGDPANVSLLDHNGDQLNDLSDAIALLTFLFQGGTPPLGGLACVPIPACPNACAGR